MRRSLQATRTLSTRESQDVSCALAFRSLIAAALHRYKAMVECQKKGKTKAVGVSNFSRAEMERLLKSTDTVRHPQPRTPDLSRVAYKPLFSPGPGCASIRESPLASPA